MPLLQPGQTKYGTGNDIYLRAPDGNTPVVVNGALEAERLSVVNDDGTSTVNIFTLPNASTGARGGIDIYAVDNEFDDNQVAYMRLRGFTGGDLNIARADLPGGPVPFITSSGATKDTILGYDFAPFADVLVKGALGTGLVYDTVNHVPFLKAVVGGPGAPQNEAFGAGPFSTTAPNVIGSPFTAAKTTNLLIDVEVIVDVDGATGATVGASDCIIITVDDLTGGQGTIGRSVLKPFTMPVAPGGSDYVLHTTLFAPVMVGETYEVSFNFVAPAGGLVLGSASSGIQYAAYDIRNLA
jgi:hypothetical protein